MGRRWWAGPPILAILDCGLVPPYISSFHLVGLDPVEPIVSIRMATAGPSGSHFQQFTAETGPAY